MSEPQKPTGLPRSDEWVRWLDLLVEDVNGRPQKVLAVGVTLQLESGENVPMGLVQNGYRQAWRRA
jgi:hypothetical protein